jgi:hypothetical protein
MPWLEDDPTGPHLHKSDGRRLLAEALAAQVETILADETRLMCAEAAVNNNTHECRRVLMTLVSKTRASVTRTTGEIPFQTCGDGKTRRRRESFLWEGCYEHTE